MQKIVVTGGGGFIGGAIARALKANGYHVLSLSRGDYPELREIGIETVRCDISKDVERVVNAFTGASAVFHVAAKVDMWGSYEDFYSSNVVSTRVVLDACRTKGVERLIYTSSPSVIADGEDLNNIDESYPYPDKYLGLYSLTKAQAEKEVLAACDENLQTISLRPHLIWGPGDNHFVPTILERARSGRLICVGRGKNLTDLTYIDDCVQAHICALEALEKNPECRGKAYFISQGDPVNLWDWINQILKIHGIAPVRRKIPTALAYSTAWLLEKIASLSKTGKVPLFTRFLVKEMATNHYFNISAAKRDLGFKPRYTIAEALQVAFSQTAQDVSDITRMAANTSYH